MARAKNKTNGTQFAFVLYKAEVIRRIELALAEDEFLSDEKLAQRLTKDGCPCSWETVRRARVKAGIPNKWNRMQSLKQSAHRMVVNQPIDGLG